jgi:hypothetical protein
LVTTVRIKLLPDTGCRVKTRPCRSAGLMLVAFPALLAAPAFARDADKAKAAYVSANPLFQAPSIVLKGIAQCMMVFQS